ncbi:HPP family protein [Pseudonocardia sp. GCM10023141]|uniref:CBS domain-containing protein n=1 Tax=Pseudonocardia sp. GCM10023141 TaxID=3252653 RepID=UPI0036177999
MRARDVMSRPVMSVRPHQAVAAAAELLTGNGFEVAPVVTAEGAVLGIVTRADLASTHSADATVAGVMVPTPSTLGPDADLADVAVLLSEDGGRPVMIVDNGHLVGIVSTDDLGHPRTLTRALAGATPVLHHG